LQAVVPEFEHRRDNSTTPVVNQAASNSRKTVTHES